MEISMTEYKSSMGGSGVDPREKYDVVGNKIKIYRRPEKIFISFRKWSLAETFNFDRETKVGVNHEKDGGSGRIALENNDGSKYDFFVYGEYGKFLDELTKYGLRITNTKF